MRNKNEYKKFDHKLFFLYGTVLFLLSKYEIFFQHFVFDIHKNTCIVFVLVYARKHMLRVCRLGVESYIELDNPILPNAAHPTGRVGLGWCYMFSFPVRFPADFYFFAPARVDFHCLEFRLASIVFVLTRFFKRM